MAAGAEVVGAGEGAPEGESPGAAVAPGEGTEGRVVGGGAGVAWATTAGRGVGAGAGERRKRYQEATVATAIPPMPTAAINGSLEGAALAGRAASFFGPATIERSAGFSTRDRATVLPASRPVDDGFSSASRAARSSRDGREEAGGGGGMSGIEGVGSYAGGLYVGAAEVGAA